MINKIRVYLSFKLQQFRKLERALIENELEIINERLKE